MVSPLDLANGERNAKTRSLLNLEGAEEYPAGVMMIILCLIACTEGADATLFPMATQALTLYENVTTSTLGLLASVQLIFQALGGPFWGIVASRGAMHRRDILVIGTFFQGMATLLMWIDLRPAFIYPLRALNGFMLASLRPIANSIVGDRFSDVERGKRFGWIQASMQLGVTVFGFITVSIAEIEFAEGFRGWKLAFIIVGLFTLALAPICYFFLKSPPVKLSSVPSQGGVSNEVESLCKLLKIKSFAILVFQGCFGLIPWRAFDFRTFFFARSGVTATQNGVISLLGGFAAASGSALGGLVGDCLSKMCFLHGRVFCAELSIYGGIPIVSLLFLYTPSAEWAAWFFGGLSVLLGLVATWTPSGANSPILCALADDDERSLVLAWQTSLEGSVGALGPLMFTFLLGTVFQLNEDCLQAGANATECPPGEIAEKAGTALFYTSAVPWMICGGLYSMMHIFYPSDYDAVMKLREEKASEVPLVEEIGQS